MTDNEIIKALECCASECFNACDNCPFYKQCENDEQLSKFALDLINRQQAEIERYKKYCSECGKKTTKTILQLQEIIADKMAEIERLQKLLDGAEICIDEIEYALDKVGHSNSRVDYALEEYNNLVKEMVGDTE